jgi:hypothetical protein
MIIIFAVTSISLSKKRQYFCKIFRRKYLKNHSIGPWSDPDHACLVVELVILDPLLRRTGVAPVLESI